MSRLKPEDLTHRVSIEKPQLAGRNAQGLTNIEGAIVNHAQHDLIFEKADGDGEWVITPPELIPVGGAGEFLLSNTGPTSLWIYYRCGAIQVGFAAFVPAVGVNDFGIWLSQSGLKTEVKGDLRGWNVHPVYTVS